MSASLVISDVTFASDCVAAGFAPHKPFHFTETNKDCLRGYLETQNIYFNSVGSGQINDAIARCGYALVP